MANFNTSYYTSQTSTPITATKMAPTPYTIDVEYTVDTTENATDTITVCRLPANHTIIAGAVRWSADVAAATCTLNLGFAGAVDLLAAGIPIGATAAAGIYLLGQSGGDIAPTSVTGTADVICTLATADFDTAGVIRFIFLVQGTVAT